MKRSKQPHEMTAEEQAQADMTDARCLTLCIAALKRVNGVGLYLLCAYFCADYSGIELRRELHP